MRSRALIPAAVAALAALVAGCGYPDPSVNNGPVATVSETTPTPQAGADDFHDGNGRPAVKFPHGLQTIDPKGRDGQAGPAGAPPPRPDTPPAAARAPLVPRPPAR